MGDRTAEPATSGAAAGAAFAWIDHSRFVEFYPVQTGWLVLWGRYEELGRRKVLGGSRTYPDLEGARRRLVDAVLELTGKPGLAVEAVELLDRTPLPTHRPDLLSAPL